MLKRFIMGSAFLLAYTCMVAAGLWDAPFSSVELADRMWISFLGLFGTVFTYLFAGE